MNSNRFGWIAGFAALLLIFPAITHSATINIPVDYPTIQLGIDAAVHGDVVLVAPGTYVENIDFKGKEIILQSKEGPNKTTIDGNQQDIVIRIENGEGPGALVDGFTITNGKTNSSGGGIWIAYGSSPCIKDNFITYNLASHGGGIACHTNSNAIIDNNVVSNNVVSSSGGGIIAFENSAPIIKNNIIYNNISNNPASYGRGGGIWLSSSSPFIFNNLIYHNHADNTGGGIYCYYKSKPTISGNTISDNFAGLNGGGVASRIDSNPSILNSIIYENTANGSGAEIYNQSGVSVSYCNIKGGWPGISNINADPLFFNPSNHDFHLNQDPCQPGIINPCVDSGDPTSPMLKGTTRTDGVFDSGIIDMGYHYIIEPFEYLNADVYQLSETTGGMINFTLTAGLQNAKRDYLLFGGLSGTSPGNPLPGGYVVLPLNWDLFTNITIEYVNSIFFMNFYGLLNKDGEGAAIFNTLGPLPSGLTGITFSFAYAIFYPWDFVSNPVNVEVVP